MKSVLLSKQPKIVDYLLNGISKIIVCKKFPKDYVGWVYIYCTKGNKKLCHNIINFPDVYINDYLLCSKQQSMIFKDTAILNSKVIARFWCDKVGEIKRHNAYSLCTEGYYTFVDKFYSDADLQKASCLTGNELSWYLKGDNNNKVVGYAIHISKLEVFDRPKELGKFYKYDNRDYLDIMCDSNSYTNQLTKAPKNYCYIER